METNLPERTGPVETRIETAERRVLDVPDGVRVAAEALGYIDAGRMDLAKEVLRWLLRVKP